MSETKTNTLIVLWSATFLSQHTSVITLHYYSTCACFCSLTFKPAVKVRVGCHLEPRMWQQEAADVGEAGVDVLPYVLQLFMLVLFHLF